MLHGYCEPYHYIDGLLSRCARAGNLIAEFLLAKAILLGRIPLWTKMMVNDLHNRSIKCATCLPLSESLKIGSITELPYFLFCSEDLPNIHDSYERLLFTRLEGTRGNYLHFVAICLILFCFLRDTIVEEMCLRFQILSVLNEGRVDRCWWKYSVELGFERHSITCFGSARDPYDLFEHVTFYVLKRSPYLTF